MCGNLAISCKGAFQVCTHFYPADWSSIKSRCWEHSFGAIQTSQSYLKSLALPFRKVSAVDYSACRFYHTIASFIFNNSFFCWSWIITILISSLWWSVQIRKRLMVSEKGHLEWKKMYFKMSRCYPHKEQYSDTLQFCTHCHILFWKVTIAHGHIQTSTAPLHTCIKFLYDSDITAAISCSDWNSKWGGGATVHLLKLVVLLLSSFCLQDTNHPCTANNAESCCVPVSPQGFINLFKFWGESAIFLCTYCQ